MLGEGEKGQMDSRLNGIRIVFVTPFRAKKTDYYVDCSRNRNARRSPFACHLCLSINTASRLVFVCVLFFGCRLSIFSVSLLAVTPQDTFSQRYTSTGKNSIYRASFSRLSPLFI